MDSERPHRAAVTLSARVAGGCLVATLLLAVLPFVSAYQAPALDIVLETANALVALLVCYLLYGRFRRSGRLQELLLVCSLAVVAMANLVLTAIPGALTAELAVTQWAPLVVRFLATLLLCAAALLPAGAVVSERRAAPGVLLLAIFVAVVVALALVVADGLPPPVRADQLAGAGDSPVLTWHRTAFAAQAISALLYGVAAVAFTRRAEANEDVLLRWVAAGCVLAAFARVHYLLFPSLYSGYVSTGDLLRTGYYVLLLVGAAREIATYWSAQAQAAVLEDRRRMARDLHDGLTQELSYIWSQSRLLSQHPDQREPVDRINGAAARALDEARGAIAALTQPPESGFDAVLRDRAQDLANRYDTEVAVHLDDDLIITPEQADAVLRIVAEGLRNAVLHGHASRVEVHVTAPLRVVVTDDGKGFATEAPTRGGGFGLTSMRERAERLGACFSIHSSPGAGTTLTISWA